jgi:hypothetical protein
MGLLWHRRIFRGCARRLGRLLLTPAAEGPTRKPI